jgi:outer membrane protein assembly factor BamA
VTDWLRVGADARLANVRFGETYDARHSAGGLHAVVDTRIDPSFPRNAIHARLGWERLDFQADLADRWLTDVRGYVGIGGSRVLALRGQLARSNTALPLAEQVLLGGSESLRGYPTGYRAGDNMASGTIEIRQPLNSPLSVGRFGVKAFVDAGTTWSAGRRMGDQPFDRGIGGGVYFGAGPFVMDLDVAWPEEGKPRAHFGMGVTF